MLRALHRLLRPGGRMAFSIIHLAAGLDAPSRLRARRSGPRAVASRADTSQLLRSAGFVDVDTVDVTDPFIHTARAWISERDAHAADLAPLEPAGVFEQRQHDHRRQLAATEDGLLRRSLFSAARAPQ